MTYYTYSTNNITYNSATTSATTGTWFGMPSHLHYLQQQFFCALLNRYYTNELLKPYHIQKCDRKLIEFVKKRNPVLAMRITNLWQDPKANNEFLRVGILTARSEGVEDLLTWAFEKVVGKR